MVIGITVGMAIAAVLAVAAVVTKYQRKASVAPWKELDEAQAGQVLPHELDEKSASPPHPFVEIALPKAAEQALANEAAAKACQVLNGNLNSTSPPGSISIKMVPSLSKVAVLRTRGSAYARDSCLIEWPIGLKYKILNNQPTCLL